MKFKKGELLLTKLLNESVRPYLIIDAENGVYKGIPITSLNKNKSLILIKKEYGLIEDAYLVANYKLFYFEDILKKLGEVPSTFLNQVIEMSKDFKEYTG